MKTFLRIRNLFLIGGGLLILALSLFSDPDHGLATLFGWLGIGQGIWAVMMAHFALKALFDYGESDKQLLMKKASETSTGAGLCLLSLSIILFGLLTVFSPRAHASTYVPEGFLKYKNTLIDEKKNIGMIIQG